MKSHHNVSSHMVLYHLWCHQSDLERVSILNVALNEEYLHELRLHITVFP